MVACATCGNQSPAGSIVCQFCGATLRAMAAAPTPGAPPSAGPAAPPMPSAVVQTRPSNYAPPYYARPALAPKDPSTGLLLELLPGLFGFLGIGHIWAGDIGVGLGLLFGYWIFWGFAWFFIVFASVFTFGLAFCFAPFVWIGAPVLSGILLRDKLARLQGRPVMLRR